MAKLKTFTLLFLLSTIPLTAQALEVIRVDIEHNPTTETTSSQSIDIQLFDNVVSDTVSNFLSYVDDGSYNDLFINRSSTDFVIQTGGYTFNSTAEGGFTNTEREVFENILQPVPAKEVTVLNEFSLSNLRGTLAMAKLPNQPDSADSEWFINLADNTFLDTDNGGFTVFGKVLGDGMAILDSIASIPVYDLSAELNDNKDFVRTPLTNFDSSLTVDKITNNNLVFLNTFKHLFHITDTVDFGDAVDAPAQRNVVITNTGTDPLTTGTIDTASVSAPFSILSNNCENVILLAGATCIIEVDFSPTSIDYFSSSINVEISTYGYDFPVTLKTPAPELIVSQDSVDFGAQRVYDPSQGFPEQAVIRLDNIGDHDLKIFPVTFGGANASEFEFIDNCTRTSTIADPRIISAGGFCILVINFKPVDLNIKHAYIEIASDNPTDKLINIPITGGATDDNDGIPRSEEDSAPNNGDANNDGLPDGLQDNVVSFINFSGSFTTLVTDTANKFSQVIKLPASDLTDLPAVANFSTGLFSFQLTGIVPGNGANVGVILPTHQSQKHFYAYGPSAANPQPHWSELDNTTIPAAVFFGNVSLNNSAGTSINANIAQLVVVDGGDGDGDSTENGMISFTGATDIDPSSDDSSGSVSFYWLLIMVYLSTFLRMKKTSLLDTKI